MQGCTPLHACACGYTKRSDWYAHITTKDCDPADLAVCLLDHGANPTIKNQQASVSRYTAALAMHGLQQVHFPSFTYVCVRIAMFVCAQE